MVNPDGQSLTGLDEMCRSTECPFVVKIMQHQVSFSGKYYMGQGIAIDKKIMR